MKLWEQDRGTLDEWGYTSIEEYMKEQYAQGDIGRVQYGPVARPLSAEVLFSPQAYDGARPLRAAAENRRGEVQHTEPRAWTMPR
jgi:hypothetical protein